MFLLLLLLPCRSCSSSRASHVTTLLDWTSEEGQKRDFEAATEILCSSRQRSCCSSNFRKAVQMAPPWQLHFNGARSLLLHVIKGKKGRAAWKKSLSHYLKKARSSVVACVHTSNQSHFSERNGPLILHVYVPCYVLFQWLRTISPFWHSMLKKNEKGFFLLP